MSDSSFRDLASNKLWEDLDENSEFPSKRPLLAHYTSIQTFEQIVTTKQFWFSNPLFMNDLEELKFGMDEGREASRDNQELKNACGDSNYKIFLDRFDSYFKDFDLEQALNTYLFCFSEHDRDNNDGLLSMWRGYGNGGLGASIVIDTENINFNNNSPLIIGKVRYASKEERRKWINGKIGVLADAIKTQAESDDDYCYAAWAWFERLKVFALFSKHHGFAEEREWRVVYLSDRDKGQKFKEFFGHVVTNRGIEPKLKFPLMPIEGLTPKDLTLEKLIFKVILGPSLSSALSVSALKQMLRNLGRECLVERIVVSDIPFRPIIK